MRYITILLLLWAAKGLAADDGACTRLWNDEHVSEVAAVVWRVPEIPEEGVISGFSINELRTSDGRLYRPRSVSESTCALDRMLGAKTRGALRAGIEAYVRTTASKSPEDRFVSLDSFVNARLDRLYVKGGMAPDTGVSHVLGRVREQFGIIRSVAVEDDGPLRQEAAQLNIYSANVIVKWLWVKYLEHLGVDGFDSVPLVRDLQFLDAPVAPPESLQVHGCPEALKYDWGAITQPLITFRDVDPDDVVHWGVCGPSNTLWVYHYQNGWREADPREEPRVCDEFGGAGELAELCRRRVHSN